MTKSSSVIINFKLNNIWYILDCVANIIESRSIEIIYKNIWYDIYYNIQYCLGLGYVYCNLQTKVKNNYKIKIFYLPYTWSLFHEYNMRRLFSEYSDFDVWKIEFQTST